MSNTTRFQTRKTSRSRTKVEQLNPCVRYTTASGYNPFWMVLQALKFEKTPEQKAEDHNLKMITDQKRAKARSQRRKNTQNRGN